jgi:tetratricopeptide (TPR) repeat protein
VLHRLCVTGCALALLAGSAARGEGVVPGIPGSSSSTVRLKPAPPPSAANPRAYRPTKPPPPVPEAAGDADLRGLAAIRAGDCDAAIRAYDEALAIAPGTASYLVNRGQCLAVNGRLDQAIDDLDAAIRKAPELALIVRDARVGMRIRRGGARLEAGAPAGALEDFRAARTLDPGSALAWSEEAVAVAQLARPRDCITAATRALKLEPRRVEALCTRASCLAKLGRRAEALEDLSAAISIQPRGEAYASRAVMHFEAGHVGPAKRDAREAVRLEPRLEPMMQRVLKAER